MFHVLQKQNLNAPFSSLRLLSILFFLLKDVLIPQFSVFVGGPLHLIIFPHRKWQALVRSVGW